MKTLLQIVLFCLALPCFAQPIGHQKIFLEITDNGYTLDFKSCFNKKDIGRKRTLDYKNYQLLDLSTNPTGFEFYSRAEFVHKTLMTDDHYIRIVKNKTDTMNIEILNCFNVYFLSIKFQKGNFRLYVNDGKLYEWNYNTLPFKRLSTESLVYDITPSDWSVFQLDNRKYEQDYFISIQFAKQELLAKAILPEDDPNFRNLRRIHNLKKEVADYNFDGQQDYREYKFNSTTQWNYFIYKDSVSGFVLDTILSSLDLCSFDFEKKIFVGSKTRRINPVLTQTDNYEYIAGKPTLVRQMQCVHAFPNSEKTDCSYYILQNGKMVFEKLIKGSE
jgi:hypothetical protein